MAVIDFNYTGAVQTTTLTKGKYKFQVWGAQGGSYSDSYQGGYGGYSEGILTLKEDTDIFVYVGGQPKQFRTGSTSSAGGFNGGGKGNYYNFLNAMYQYGQSGGGGTDIRIGTDSLYARVIVAGGGSGGVGGANTDQYNLLTTGYGGGLTGGNTSNKRATQTAGYSFGVGGDGQSNSSTKSASSAGGGGWYGGYSATAGKDASGGGSGYVYTEESAVNYPSGCLLNESYYLEDATTLGYGDNIEWDNTDGSTELGHSGNGFARITTIEDDITSDTHSTFKLYSNSEWKSYTVYTYKDGSFKQCDIYTYNNDKFNKV